MKTVIVPDINALPSAVEELLTYGKDKRKILIQGEMGAGKTAFVKAFCDYFGVRDTVSSPTYAIVNEYVYDRQDGEPGKIYHFDLYRLEDIEEVLLIGIEEYLENEHYCLIEWPEIIEPLVSDEYLRIKIEITGDSSRKILFL